MLSKVSKIRCPSIAFKRVRHVPPPVRPLRCVVAGACSHVGQPLSLLLKQRGLPSELVLYDSSDTAPLLADLAQVQSDSRIFAFTGPEKLVHALTGANVVLIVTGVPASEKMTYDEQFSRNAEDVKNIAEEITKTCPTALVGVLTEPVNSTLPLVSYILCKAGLNTSNVLGCTSLDTIRACGLASAMVGLPFEHLRMPVVGGHSPETMVPVFSKLRPRELSHQLSNLRTVLLHKVLRPYLPLWVTQADMQKMTASLRSLDAKRMTLSAAFAGASFATSLLDAAASRPGITECAFVPCDALPDLKFLALPLELGPSGVVKPPELPRLSRSEACLLDEAIPLIQMDVARAQQFLQEENLEIAQ